MTYRNPAMVRCQENIPNKTFRFAKNFKQLLGASDCNYKDFGISGQALLMFRQPCERQKEPYCYEAIYDKLLYFACLMNNN